MTVINQSTVIKVLLPIFKYKLLNFDIVLPNSRVPNWKALIAPSRQVLITSESCAEKSSTLQIHAGDHWHGVHRMHSGRIEINEETFQKVMSSCELTCWWKNDVKMDTFWAFNIICFSAVLAWVCTKGCISLLRRHRL